MIECAGFNIDNVLNYLHLSWTRHTSPPTRILHHYRPFSDTGHEHSADTHFLRSVASDPTPLSHWADRSALRRSVEDRLGHPESHPSLP